MYACRGIALSMLNQVTSWMVGNPSIMSRWLVIREPKFGELLAWAITL
jgi:hypothetical protein